MDLPSLHVLSLRGTQTAALAAKRAREEDARRAAAALTLSRDEDGGSEPDYSYIMEWDDSAFYDAVGKNDIERVRYILENSGPGGRLAMDIGLVEASGALTPLAPFARVEMMMTLLDAGADPNATYRNVSALSWAVESETARPDESRGAVRLLLRAGAAANHAILLEAVRSGNLEITDLLLDDSLNPVVRAANVNAANEDGVTALIVASEKGFIEMSRQLLAAGASVFALFDNRGRTALAAASKKWLGMVRLLLDNGAKVNVAEDDGMTPLMHASDQGRIKIVETLLEAQADVQATRSDGETALSLAAKRSHLAVVALLSARMVPRIMDLESL